MSDGTEPEANVSGDVGALVDAVNEVVSAVRELRKTGKNTFHRYDYYSEEDLTAALRQPMARAGLFLAPIGTESEVTECQGKQGVRYRTDVRVRYLLMHSGGGQVVLESRGSGMDHEDKGVGKAMTSAIKILYRELFRIAGRDDCEADEPQGQPQQEQRRPDPTRAAGRTESAAPQPRPEPERPAEINKERAAHAFVQLFKDHGLTDEHQRQDELLCEAFRAWSGKGQPPSMADIVGQKLGVGVMRATFGALRRILSDGGQQAAPPAEPAKPDKPTEEQMREGTLKSINALLSKFEPGKREETLARNCPAGVQVRDVLEARVTANTLLDILDSLRESQAHA